MIKKTYALLFSLSIYAAQAQTKVDLNPVSVTANRTSEYRRESGRSITIVEGKTFQDMPLNSLDELLRFVPGVEVQSRGPMGAQSDIVIRGGTYQQVLVLLDGVKMNDPITGHFNGNMPVAPYEIERIEILRGPASAVYGAEAVGGVINIITKNFHRHDSTSRSEGQIKLVGGEYKMYGIDAGLRVSRKNYNLTAAVLSNNTEGQLLRAGSRGYAYNHSVGASFSALLPRQWRLSWRTSYDNRDFAAQNFYTTFSSDDATEKVTVLWNQLQLRQQTKNGSQQFDAVYKRSTDHYQFNKTAIANENNADFVMVQYLNTQGISSKMSGSFGGQLSQRGIQSNDRGNHQTRQVAVFGTLHYAIQKWRMAAALRTEHDQNYGFAVLPQASISYVLPKVTLRSNAGRAIRSADFTERYNNYNKNEVASGSIGNPNLLAEQSWSYEVGALFSLSQHFSLNTAAFLRQQNNLIDWVNTPFAQMPRQSNLLPAGNYALARNIKDLNTQGAELEVQYQNRWKHQQLQASAGLTLLHSQSTDPNPSFYILAHAKWLFQSSVQYQYRNLMLSANMMYKERKSFVAPAINAAVSSSYCLVNAQAAYRLAQKWTFALRCHNVGDVAYSDLLGSKMPNRWWSGSIMYRF